MTLHMRARHELVDHGKEGCADHKAQAQVERGAPDRCGPIHLELSEYRGHTHSITPIPTSVPHQLAAGSPTLATSKWIEAAASGPKVPLSSRSGVPRHTPCP